MKTRTVCTIGNKESRAMAARKAGGLCSRLGTLLVPAQGILFCLTGQLGAAPLSGDGLQDQGRQPLTTFDSSGSGMAGAETVRVDASNASDFVKSMKNALHDGELARIGVIAPEVLKVRGDLGDAHALLALHQLVSGETEAARKGLASARERGADEQLLFFVEAMDLLRSGALEKAEARCRKAIETGEPHAYGWNILGRIQLAAGRDAEARQSFRKAVGLNAGFVPAHINLGVVALAAGEPGVALESLAEAKRRDTREARIDYGMALAYEAMGDPVSAGGALAEALRINPEFVPALSMLGALQATGRNYPEAVETGRRMVELEADGAREFLAGALLQAGDAEAARAELDKVASDSARVQLLRVTCALEAKDYQGALDMLDDLMQEDPNHFGGVVTRAAVRLVLGEPSGLQEVDLARWGDTPRQLLEVMAAAGHGLAGDSAGAHASLAEGVTVLPGFSLAGLGTEALAKGVKKAEWPHLALGFLMHVQDYRSLARAQYEAALATHPESPLANCLLGVLLLETGDADGADKHLQAALAKAPRFFPALYSLGDLAMRRRQADRALEYLGKAYAVKPTPGIDMRMGVIYENTDRFEEAEACYQRFVEATPKSFIGHNQLAWLYASRGRKLDQALELANQANDLMPGNSSILDTRGWIRYQQDDLDGALEDLVASLRVNPHNPTVIYHLGVVHAARGNQAKARESLQQALELSGNFAEAAEARKLLKKLR